MFVELNYVTVLVPAPLSLHRSVFNLMWEELSLVLFSQSFWGNIYLWTLNSLLYSCTHANAGSAKRAVTLRLWPCPLNNAIYLFPQLSVRERLTCFDSMKTKNSNEQGYNVREKKKRNRKWGKITLNEAFITDSTEAGWENTATLTALTQYASLRLCFSLNFVSLDHP